MPIINQLNTSNTFQEWLNATKDVITSTNSLAEGPSFVGNTLLLLTASGTSLNVRNNAVINTQTSNTITSGNVIINRPAGSGNTLNVVASAVVGQNLFVSNLIVSRSASIPAGAFDLTSVNFTDLTISGLANTNTLIVRSWMYQQGANARFDGAVDFTNTSVYSVNARGNIFTSNNFQAQRNVICENITVNSVANVVTLRIGTIEPRVVTGTITFNSNVSVAADKITQLQGNVRITGNTELGPYTESLFDFGTSVGTNQNLNLRTGSAFRINLSSSVRLTVINPPPAGRMAMATIFIRSGTAGATPTLAGNTAAGAAGTLRYAYDAAPVFDTGLNKTSVVTMTTIDGGVNWFVSAPILGATSTT
jgi:hypothetical protein